jgi:murein DD-endopeptidase MepM/ murein hydrolase activator NlpD
MFSKFFSTIIAILLLFSTTIPSAQAQSSYPSYVIQPGDSLGYIADLFDTTIDDIAQVNNLGDVDMISPGQVILIPSYPGLSGILTIITTNLGETYGNLPAKYQVTREQILEINNLLSPASVYAGSELILLLPIGSEPLTPAAITTEAQTSLEISARLQANPRTLMLQNQYSHSHEYLPGTVVFSRENSQNPAIDLFAHQMGEVTFAPLPLVQGATEVISVLTDQDVTLSGFIGERPLQFFSVADGEFYALQGIHALQQPGLITFSLTAMHRDGTSQTFSQSVLVEPGIFEDDPPLNVNPSTIDPSITGPENELIQSLVSTASKNRYWDGIFLSPAYYQEYNSLFGTRRKYNDDPTVYFHTGVDFAGGMTLPIVAPAAGQVVFAGPLSVRGNTVFIDHGWGVFSGFFHQQTLLVKEGDHIAAGQQIGTVGNTGRVNGAGDYEGAGAHLHWEVWVNGVQVDPLDWLSFEYP